MVHTSMQVLNTSVGILAAAAGYYIAYPESLHVAARRSRDRVVRWSVIGWRRSMVWLGFRAPPKTVSGTGHASLGGLSAVAAGQRVVSLWPPDGTDSEKIEALYKLHVQTSERIGTAEAGIANETNERQRADRDLDGRLASGIGALHGRIDTSERVTTQRGVVGLPLYLIGVLLSALGAWLAQSWAMSLILSIGALAAAAGAVRHAWRSTHRVS